MVIGYAVKNIEDPKFEIQLKNLGNFQCEIIFKERKKIEKSRRPVLNKLLNTVRRGDRVIIWKLEMLGSSVTEIIDAIYSFYEKEVELMFIEDNLDTRNDYNKTLYMAIVGLKKLIWENSSYNNTVAKNKLAKRRGRKPGLSKSSIQKALQVKELHDKGRSIGEIAKILNSAKATCYRYLFLLENKELVENEKLEVSIPYLHP